MNMALWVAEALLVLVFGFSAAVEGTQIRARAVEALQRHRATQDLERATWGPGRNGEDLVCTRRTPRRSDPNTPPGISWRS
jgi:hypothetical protein